MRVGAGWQAQLHEAIEQADALVLAITPNWIASPYCQWEFVTGVELGKGIIPVVLEVTDLPERISSLQYEDFTAGFENSETNEKFLNDLHTMSQTLAKQSEDEQVKQAATKAIETQIKQANEQTVTIGDVTDSNININQSNIGNQVNNYSEKQRNWTAPVILGLIIAMIGSMAGVAAHFPDTVENITGVFAQPTPLEGQIFTDDEVGIVLADFADLDAGALAADRRIERQFEDANIPFIRVNHTINDREQAQEIADLYNATITIWGESSGAGIEVFYEITPLNERQVSTTIDNLAVPSDLENFNTYIFDGMDTSYIVNFTQGQLHYFEEDYETALSFFDEAVESIPAGREDEVRASILHFYTGNALSVLEDYDAAIVSYNTAIELDSQYTLVYLNRGSTYALSENHISAIVDYSRAIELEPQLDIAYLYRSITYAELGVDDLALSDLEWLEELNPIFAAELHNNIGISLYEEEEYNSAIAVYGRAIELNPNFVTAYNNRSAVYADLGEYDLALQDYNQIIELDPTFHSAYYNRGTIYADLEKYQLAIADYSRAIDLAPHFPESYGARGLANYELGIQNYEAAIADYREYERLTGELRPFMVERIAEMEAALAGQ